MIFVKLATNQKHKTQYKRKAVIIMKKLKIVRFF